ncbi:MAG: flagellar hook-associated protein FlgL [Planctomycetota bacterium]|nr:flagellar hook-associated protein FlgL [Planctomycetota bacterium]
MAILPLGIARVSNLLSTQIATQSIEANQAQLLTVENQLSTGLRVSTPSDDPAASSMIMQMQQTLARRQAYASNITSASSQLGETDSTLGDLTAVLQQAQQLASANVGTTATPDQRKSAATVAKSLYSQALSIANKSFNNAFLFGGDSASQAPFVSGPAGLQYTGTSQTLNNLYDDGTSLSFQVSGSSVFGALSSQVGGSTNVSPSLTAVTRLSDLGGAVGHGVHLGPIQISNGAVTKTVDFSSASGVGDIVNTINQAAIGGITASISGQKLVISGAPTDNIAIIDVGGTTAADLGINTAVSGAGAGVTVTGGNLNPLVTPITPVANLLNGAGLDGSGLVITNGTISKTVAWGPGSSVQDMLNAINGANVGVLAKINGANNGIVIANATQGTTLTIGENGGQTATQLGVRTFSPSMALAQLNNGSGVRAVGGATPDFQIKARDGSTFAISISTDQTVQDVMNTINAATGGAVTASFASTGNGIVLTDATGGGGTLDVTSLNFSNAAADLGLTVPATGNVVNGADVSGLQSGGLLGNLNSLVTALQSGTQAQITAASEGIQADLERVTGIQGQTGAVEQELQNRQTQMDQENTATKALVSKLQDTDFTTAITQFQTLQTALQANYQTAAKQLNLSLLDFLH